MDIEEYEIELKALQDECDKMQAEYNKLFILVQDAKTIAHLAECARDDFLEHLDDDESAAQIKSDFQALQDEYEKLEAKVDAIEEPAAVAYKNKTEANQNRHKFIEDGKTLVEEHRWRDIGFGEEE